MSPLDKPRNPFLPGQPATVELFVGRQAQITHLLQRGVRQTALGKPTVFFIEGEYGIGKSSLANYCLQAAEQEYGLLGISASMAGQRDLDGTAESILKSLVTSAHRNRSFWAKVKDVLGRFVDGAQLFGVSLKLSEVAAAAPRLADVAGFLETLRGLLQYLPSEGGMQPGVFLVLDEINGIASHAPFAHFLKGVVDRNALQTPSVPLCLVLCGTAERRKELVACHEPVGRLFDVIEVPPLSRDESSQFFLRAFESAGMRVKKDALERLVQYGSGQPRILHMLGDHAFWIDSDQIVDGADVDAALQAAAKDFWRKYVGPQVVDELNSADYRSILKKIAAEDPLAPAFSRAKIAEGLSQSERGKLDNFLQRMKQLNVIRQGEEKGEWVFNTPMVRTAMFLFAEALAN
jgi:hypothetical protein